MGSMAIILNYISGASLSDLKQVQRLLSTRINELCNVNTPINVDNYVSHVPDFITDKNLLNDAISELDDLDMAVDKTDTQWVNVVDEQYMYNGYSNKPVLLMANCPSVQSIMAELNNCDLEIDGGPMDSCLITKYPSGCNHLNWHADDEGDQIDQSSSVCTISIGADREINFRKKLPHKVRKKVKASPILGKFKLSEGSLTIMKPGCQQALEHRVPRSKQEGVRYSLSFRKFIRKGIAPQNAEINNFTSTSFDSEVSFSKNSEFSPTEPVNFNFNQNQKLPSAMLFCGDSYFQALDPVRLSRKKNLNIFNIAKGGKTIDEIKDSMVLFSSSHADSFDVTKVFISCGTNDIRHSKNGVKYLSAPISDLLKKAKLLFPSARIYCQSLLPLPSKQRPNIVRDINDLNNIIFKACEKQKCCYVNIMPAFLNMNTRQRNHVLFQQGNNIHPNKSGYGILARIYINIIHSKRYNPLVMRLD